VRRQTFPLGDRVIGSDAPPYVVAELCANHNGSLDRALAIMEAAKAAGADAVKLQTYTPETMTVDSNAEEFVLRGGLWDGYSLYDLYAKAHTPRAWHPQLFAKGRELGIAVFSTPFDETAVDFLEQFDPPAYKIASFEIVDLPLIEKVASTRRPMILSTGTASFAEIRAAVDTARQHGARDIALLHCISAYPAPVADSNLRSIPKMAQEFGVPIGLSDHSLGIGVALAAVALGGCLIEKHFTLGRSAGGLDDSFSIEPEELRALVTDARAVWEALGTGDERRAPSELALRTYRRSLYAARDIDVGEVLTRAMIRSLRPGLGIPPTELPKLVGRVARRSIKRGTPLTWDLVE